MWLPSSLCLAIGAILTVLGIALNAEPLVLIGLALMALGIFFIE